MESKVDLKTATHAFKITLPGSYINEIKGKEVLLITESDGTITTIKEVRKDLNNLDEIGEPVKLSYIGSQFAENIEMQAKWSLILEQAAYRLLKRLGEI